MTTLQMGSTGSDVTQLQNALNALGYGITVDGNFGITTKSAVMHFQSTNGLTVDGIVGPETFNGIKTAVAGGTPVPMSLAAPVKVNVSVPRPSASPTPVSGGGVTSTLAQYQNYVLYGAIGFVGILVIMKMTRKK